MKLERYAKAIVAALIMAYGMYQAAKGAQTAAGEGVAFDEWVNIVGGAVIAGFGVWAVPNAKAAPVAGETESKPLHVETSIVAEDAPAGGYDDVSASGRRPH